MTATSTTAVAKTYVFLREAAKLTRGPQGDALRSGARMMIAALQLRSFTLVRDCTHMPDIPRPATIVECLALAAAQTSHWDLAQLPSEAAEFITDLADLRHSLGEGTQP